MKPKWYFDKCWRQNYFFLIGWTEKKAIEYLKKNFSVDAEIEPSCQGKAFQIPTNDGVKFVIWTKYRAISGHTTATIAHECLHVANWTLHLRGVQPSFLNDEPAAYLMTELIRQAVS